jgi:Polycystin cation channel
LHSFQKAFKQIAATIKLCFVGLSTFVVEFVIVFGAFCCYFFFMLSPYMDTFRDISHSIENTIAMAIGKFSFSSLRAASNFAAWIFFLFSGEMKYCRK